MPKYEWELTDPDGRKTTIKLADSGLPPMQPNVVYEARYRVDGGKWEGPVSIKSRADGTF